MSQLYGMDFSNLNTAATAAHKNNNSNVENVRNTIGNPKISKTASSYYDELKAKHNDVEFVLVSDNHVDKAKELSSNINTSKSMIVLISESELEQMATDEATRNKNEQLIADAKAQMPGLLEELKKSGTDVKSFGMEFNKDGTTSYFAVVDESLAAQKERIEKQQEAKKADAKDDASKKVDNSNKPSKLKTITANSMDELIKKLQDSLQMAKTDSVLTEQEKMVGQHFDLKF